MARTRATIYVTCWNDADFRALPALAKYLYWSLLAQSKLTIAGCLDLKVGRWADLSPDTPPDLVEHLLDVLEDRRYVAVDRETDELVIRTFVKHDVSGNKNSQRGVWGAWQGIESEYLRRWVVANLPDAMWGNPDVAPPEEAVRMRAEPLSERPSERPIQQASERSTEPPIPSPVPPPTPTSAADVVSAAARLLAEREADRRGDEVGNFDGYVRSRTAPIRREHEQAWTAMLAADPTLTAEQLVAPKPKSLRSLDPTEQTAAAAQARYAREEARRNGTPCGRCEGDGQLVDAENRWSPCPACNGSGLAA